jgi:hypothetical protein
VRRVLSIGCSGLLVLMLAGAAVASYAWVPREARSAALGLFADLRAHDYARALQRTSARYQRGHDVTAFERSVHGVPELDSHSAAWLPHGTIEGEHASLDGTLETPRGARSVAIELVREQSYWYVDAVLVAGEPLE